MLFSAQRRIVEAFRDGTCPRYRVPWRATGPRMASRRASRRPASSTTDVCRGARLPQAGFSTGTPWLALNPNAEAIDAELRNGVLRITLPKKRSETGPSRKVAGG